ncbi:MAG: hypothetical protein ACTSO7_05715 [Candidatus Heimdallarchaeota archaeon]
MDTGPLRWASSEGAFLFQVPDEGSMFPIETTILLSSSLFAISIFLEYGQLKFNDEELNIIRLNFPPPHNIVTLDEQEANRAGYVIHSSYKGNFCFQSIFHGSEITNELSEFEKAFLDSVVNNVLDKLAKEGRSVSDIPFLKDRIIIDDVEEMLKEIDNKYKALAASWSLSVGPDSEISRFDFTDVYYNGKIQVKDLFYDLDDRAIESFNQILLDKEGKMVLYKIAKSLVGLSSLLYGDDNISEDKLNFAQSEIILEAENSKKLYRLDVRSYDVEGEAFCDITIMA